VLAASMLLAWRARPNENRPRADQLAPYRPEPVRVVGLGLPYSFPKMMS
jgi:hypothetical protein